ncbi:MAG: histidine triad nucleotide-binding protein [Gammaproteobacteria bacterium]|nr:histidine triad nucleotide-binding protein [Gammaproteobacteria bacterium]
MSDCLFCNIVDGKIPAEIVYENKQVVAFRDLNPQAPLHVLLIPKKHIATLNDLESEDSAVMGALILAAKKVAEAEGVAESGYRTVINCGEQGGQSVYHIHLHLLAGRQMQWPPG